MPIPKPTQKPAQKKVERRKSPRTLKSPMKISGKVLRKILFIAVMELDDQDSAWKAYELEQYLNSPEITREIATRFGFVPRFHVNNP